jgi:hypothetical protein
MKINDGGSGREGGGPVSEFHPVPTQRSLMTVITL